MGLVEGLKEDLIEGLEVGGLEAQPLRGAPAKAPANCTEPADCGHLTQSSDEQLAKAPP